MSSFTVTSGTASTIAGSSTIDKKGFGTVDAFQPDSFGSTSDVSVIQMFGQESYDTDTLVVSGRIMYIDIGGTFSEVNIRGYSFPWASWTSVFLNRYSIGLTEAQYDDLFSGNETVYIDESVPIQPTNTEGNMATATAVASQTIAGTYALTLAAGASAQVYCIPNMGARESVKLIRSIDGGSTYTVPVNGGDPEGNVLLSSDNNSAIVTGPGYFRIDKPVTAVATAIHVDT